MRDRTVESLPDAELVELAAMVKRELERRKTYRSTLSTGAVIFDPRAHVTVTVTRIDRKRYPWLGMVRVEFGDGSTAWRNLSDLLPD